MNCHVSIANHLMQPMFRICLLITGDYSAVVTCYILAYFGSLHCDCVLQLWEATFTLIIDGCYPIVVSFFWVWVLKLGYTSVN